MGQSAEDELAEQKGTAFRGQIAMDLLEPHLRHFIEKQREQAQQSGLIALDELNVLHEAWLKERFRRQLKRIEGEAEDPEDLRHPEIPDIYTDFGAKPTFGERIADRMARFGGSWAFIAIFLGFLAVWITTNVLWLHNKGFDPYPFILLNLALSMISALQAPVIMMSQNRTERMDRLRSEHDFRVNLRAELELRSLHAKFDRLMSYQWERLEEIDAGREDGWPDRN